MPNFAVGSHWLNLCKVEQSISILHILSSTFLVRYIYSLHFPVMYVHINLCSYNTRTPCNKTLFPSLALEPPLLSITSGSSWLYVNWNAQSAAATFRVLYRESGAPDYQVIAPTTSQLSHNISALQPNTLYNIVVESTHTVTQDKVNSSVTEAYTTPRGELEGPQTMLTN